MIVNDLNININLEQTRLKEKELSNFENLVFTEPKVLYRLKYRIIMVMSLLTRNFTLKVRNKINY